MPVPEDNEPLRKPIKKKPQKPTINLLIVKALSKQFKPKPLLKSEYNDTSNVKRPKRIEKVCSEIARTDFAPNHTPGKPPKSIRNEICLFNLFSFTILKNAPRPRKTLATLCVESAVEKGKPKNSNAGNCNKPAPPPANADKKLDVNEIIIKES